jgi:uncharacterized membrane protein YdbT with pleckstrin-like domain
VRKHWIVFVQHAFGLVLSAFIPFFLITLLDVFIPGFFSQISLPVNGYALFTYAYCIWLLCLWLSFFVNWTKYYLDVWYVTEKRIIAIDQKRIFNREVSNIRFDKVQDVSVNVRGFIATLLDFGNVKVQTASEDERDFYMTAVRHPQEVRRVIFTQQNRNSEGKGSGL